MKNKILALVLILTNIGLVNPAKAQESINSEPAQSNQVVNACIHNQAETLPNPFTDVPSDHWAFKAVMTMHYCGAFRQATPPALFQRLKPTENQQQPPKNSSFNKK